MKLKLILTILSMLAPIEAVLEARGGHGDFLIKVSIVDKATNADLADLPPAEVTI